nr:MAG TPA: Sulfur globule protein [Caudoviricetes sp.]
MDSLTVQEFLKVEFNGYGNGSGDGDGSGNGDGYGDGSGNGDGYGYGDGSGDGYGYGYGYGSGYGYGYGSGYGLKTLCGEPVYMIDGVPTIITGLRGSVAMGFIVMFDLSKRKTFVVKGGGKFAHGEDLHAAQAALEEKLFDDMPVEEKLEAFREQFTPGEAYTVADFYDWHHRLTGSCTQGRDAFAQDHELSMNDAMTPEEFIDLTKDAFGGRIIRQLAEHYGIDL